MAFLCNTKSFAKAVIAGAAFFSASSNGVLAKKMNGNSYEPDFQYWPETGVRIPGKCFAMLTKLQKSTWFGKKEENAKDHKYDFNMLRFGHVRFLYLDRKFEVAADSFRVFPGSKKYLEEKWLFRVEVNDSRTSCELFDDRNDTSVKIVNGKISLSYTGGIFWNLLSTEKKGIKWTGYSPRMIKDFFPEHMEVYEGYRGQQKKLKKGSRPGKCHHCMPDTLFS